VDDEEKARLKSEILDEVGTLLRGQLAADEWGRVLVEVVRGESGEPLVAGIDVEDIVGDEATVDAVFGGDAMRPVLPVLAKATEALCGLEDVELDDVRGGTFLRVPDAGQFAWLPGLVHMPSASLDTKWDDLVSKLRAKTLDLESRVALSRHDREDVDVERQTIVFSSGGHPRVVARATLIGTYSRASRSFAWGGYSKNLPETARRASAELADALPDRDMWEVSTPVFPADEPTAWALAALVCERTGAEGVHGSRRDEGLVLLLLRDVRQA
jgi:hypothetical protein